MAEQHCVARYAYEAQERHEVSIRKNERLKLLDDSHNWWKVINEAGQTGFVPSNFVRRESFMDRAKEGLRKGLVRAHDEPENKGMAGVISYAVAKFDYEPVRDDELGIGKGDHLKVIDKSSDGWWKGELNGAVGWFPSNYVDETAEAPAQPAPQVLSNLSNGYNGEEAAQADAFYPDKAHVENGAAGDRVLETVVALFSFGAQNAEELSFKKGEHLDIVEHPAHDPDWYRARNSSGQVGLVPTNYIEIVERNPRAFYPGSVASTSAKPYAPAALSGPYASQPWYYGTLSRDQSDLELNSRGVAGDFLVRDSESNPGDYSISVKGELRNKHFLVQVSTSSGTYKIGNREFESMQALIQHYTKSPIFSNDASGEKLYLLKPLPR